MRVCGLALDIDGTITVRRGSYVVDLGLVGLLRRLEERGVPVMFVTGNALPVTAALGRYFGLPGPHVAENGCMIYYGEEVFSVCERSAREAALVVERELSSILSPSWQNMYRHYDFAFRSRVDPAEAVGRVRGLLEERGLGWVKVSYSGYAVHLRPPEASKGAGLRRALELRGLSPECVVAVGDSVMDVEMGEAGVRLAAVADADPELLEAADIVLEGASSAGVARLVRSILPVGDEG